jgi:hypothetical protein
MRDENQDRIAELKGAIEALWTEIRARRKRARKRAVDISDLEDALSQNKAERARLVQQQIESKARRHEERKAALQANQELANRRVKKARQAAARMGLFWGTYNEIIQRADAGRKHGGELRFQGFRAAGTLTAQIMGGAAPDQCVEGDHTFFGIDPPQAGHKWRYARIRIGSDGDRSPVWFSVPIVYHRPLPAKAVIKSVSITRRRVGGHVRDQLNVTVNVPAVPSKPEGSICAIDLGWRLLPEGVRVAYWCDDSGHNGQVLIPTAVIEQAAKVDSLRSTADQSREKFLPKLAAWFGTQDNLPEEWRQRIAYLGQWRSNERLAGLVEWWRGNSLPGDDDMYHQAEAWRAQYREIYQWWRNLQDQVTRRIREEYRVFAAQIAQDYARVILEEFDLREVVEKPAPDQKENNRRGQRYRQIASPSTLRMAILNACQREGTAVVKLPAQGTTKRSSVDWARIESSAADHVIATYAGGQVRDQDRNAASHLLQMWREAQAILH